MLSPVLCSHLPRSTATQLFQHLRIDVAAADDGDIQIGLRKLVAVEQECAYGHGSAGLGYGSGAVSYTHLDVYKRQERECRREIERDRQHAGTHDVGARHV